MIFDQPVGLSEAVKTLIARGIMPTDLDSDAIRQLDATLRAQSLFSARTTNEYLLAKYKALLESLVNGKDINPAYARQAIKELLVEIGYQPGADAGTIKDLGSDGRINLILQTNTDIARGMGSWIENQQPAVLDAFPAQELFRLEEREKKREWLERWRLAGAQTGDPLGTGWTITPDEEMIALKNHEIWDWIGTSDLFDDALDQPWPPFAFNSGMWVRDISRTEAEAAGLLDPGEAAPEPMDITSALKRVEDKISALAA